MTFKPGQPVSLYLDDGTEVYARPFYTVSRKPPAVVTELFTETGVPVLCVDESSGLYAFGEKGPLLHLQPPAG